MTKTKAPSGLKIDRKGYNFTFGWNIADDNYGNGQKLQWRCHVWNMGATSTTAWNDVSIGNKATQATVSLSYLDWCPATRDMVRAVEFRVRGNRKAYKKNKKTINPTVSNWSSKSFDITYPDSPDVSEQLDDTLWNKTTFTWEAQSDDSDVNKHKPLRSCEYQSILVKDAAGSGFVQAWNSSNEGWDSGGWIGATGSKSYTEDTSVISGESYTRFFRVRAAGIGGYSNWEYAEHVYAKTNKAEVTGFEVTDTSLGYSVKISWEALSNGARPIDSTSVQYLIDTPLAGCQVPNGSWQSVNVSADTSATDVAVVDIPQRLTADQCLWMKVDTSHDRETTSGEPVLVRKGNLASPTITGVEMNELTHRATVTATNASSVEDSFLLVYYKATSTGDTGGIAVGVIPHGQTSVTVQCPDWSGEEAISFGVRAVTGTYETRTYDGITQYTMSTLWMESAGTAWTSGGVPHAPTNVAVNPTSISGTVRVSWDWTWNEADGAEIGWSDHEDAWESTDQPETFTISNLQPSHWNVANLETGVKWYFRVRLFKGSGDNVTYGAWSDLSDTSIIDLATAPSKPMLILSPSVIAYNGSVTASWVYSTNDGTDQSYAEICEATYGTNGIEYGRVIAHTETAQHVGINAQDVGWQTGNTYNLCVRVRSASGKLSDEWSDPVPIAIAEPLVATITQASLVAQEYPEDPEEAEFVPRADYALTELPMTLTVTGAGEGGTTSVAIVRAEEYHSGRPDENTFDGYEGETIVAINQLGESQITITRNDLLGQLDDGALYRIVATVSDDFGQRAETSLTFFVMWSHQATVPFGRVKIDESVARVIPIAPVGAIASDTCDIYRLSVDRPELIYKGATFGEEYIDPYPVIGERGGYRFVLVTANGDYITPDSTYAWVDVEGGIEYDGMIVDFEGGQLYLRYGVNVDSEWSKGFTKTDYLGGAQVGDWTKAVTRASTATAAIITLTNPDDIEVMHNLADYAGICHVRTSQGSSFAADVQVSESADANKYGEITTYQLKITRIDPQGYEAMSAEEWYKISRKHIPVGE